MQLYMNMNHRHAHARALHMRASLLCACASPYTAHIHNSQRCVLDSWKSSKICKSINSEIDGNPEIRAGRRNGVRKPWERSGRQSAPQQKTQRKQQEQIDLGRSARLNLEIAWNKWDVVNLEMIWSAPFNLYFCGGQEKRKKRLEKETSIWMRHYNAWWSNDIWRIIGLARAFFWRGQF